MGKQRWVLQGRTDGYGEWVDLYFGLRRRDLPDVDQRIARMLGAKYRKVLKSFGSAA